MDVEVIRSLPELQEAIVRLDETKAGAVAQLDTYYRWSTHTTLEPLGSHWKLTELLPGDYIKVTGKSDPYLCMAGKNKGVEVNWLGRRRLVSYPVSRAKIKSKLADIYKKEKDVLKKEGDTAALNAKIKAKTAILSKELNNGVSMYLTSDTAEANIRITRPYAYQHNDNSTVLKEFGVHFSITHLSAIEAREWIIKLKEILP